MGTNFTVRLIIGKISIWIALQCGIICFFLVKLFHIDRLITAPASQPLEMDQLISGVQIVNVLIFLLAVKCNVVSYVWS